MNFRPEELFDLNKFEHAEIFEGVEFVWDVIKKIGNFLASKAEFFKVQGQVLPGAHILGNVSLGEGSVVEPGAVIKGPCWIGNNVQVRTGAYIRENVIIGSKSVVGNSCEIKNSILLQECQVPHFNYVGDSVLGYRAHLGAGVILSNVRLDQQEIFISHQGKKIATGLRKFGAIIGDYSEIGCNSVLNPGSIIGRRCILFPLVNWKGLLKDKSVVKNPGTLFDQNQL